MKVVYEKPCLIALFIVLFLLVLVYIRKCEIGNLPVSKTETFVNFWSKPVGPKDLTNIRPEELVYQPNEFEEYREKVSEAVKKKELNRDFNYEVARFYKTPYQYLDFQDLIIHDEDNVYNAKPEEISSNFKKYKFRTY